jgi:hypothetical protein
LAGSGCTAWTSADQAGSERHLGLARRPLVSPSPDCEPPNLDGPIFQHSWLASFAEYLERLTGAGVAAGEAELLITREWAILAGENDYTTGTF